MDSVLRKMSCRGQVSPVGFLFPWGGLFEGGAPESLGGVDPDPDPKVEGHPRLEILRCLDEIDVVWGPDDLHPRGLSQDHLTPCGDRGTMRSAGEVQSGGSGRAAGVGGPSW